MRPALRAIRAVDGLVARATVPLTERRDVVLPLLFHSLVENEADLAEGSIHPAYAVTTGQFRAVIAGLQAAGYTFLKPAELSADRCPTSGRYALVTLDDGYANQLRAVPVLEELGVSAVFFVATGYVDSDRSFWWDVLYRELTRRGADAPAISTSMAMYRAQPREAIEGALRDRFGADCLRPRGFNDRPLTQRELRRAATSQYVTLANHTDGHNVVTQFGHQELIAELNQAQEHLVAFADSRPRLFAYPDGVTDQRLRDIGPAVGIDYAFTTEPRPTNLPLRERDFGLGRFTITHEASPQKQILALRSRWSVLNTYLRLAAYRRRTQTPA